MKFSKISDKKWRLYSSCEEHKCIFARKPTGVFLMQGTQVYLYTQTYWCIPHARNTSVSLHANLLVYSSCKEHKCIFARKPTGCIPHAKNTSVSLHANLLVYSSCKEHKCIFARKPTGVFRLKKYSKNLSAKEYCSNVTAYNKQGRYGVRQL